MKITFFVLTCFMHLSLLAMDDTFSWNVPNFYFGALGISTESPPAENSEKSKPDDETILSFLPVKELPQKNSLIETFKHLDTKLIFPKPGNYLNILKKGEEYKIYDKCSLFTYKKPLREVCKELNKEEGGVELDCQLFVQVASILLGQQETQNPEVSFFLLKGVVYVEMLEEYFSSNIGCVYPLEKECLDLLNKCVWVTAKGQWLIESENQWFGFGPEGIQALSIDDWKIKTKKNLFEQIESSKATAKRPPVEESQGNILDIYQEMGKLNEWGFVQSNQFKEELQ